MIEKMVTITNRAGIHARPAAILVQAVKNAKCQVFYEKDGDRVNGKSIMGVLTLGAAYGAEITVITDGEDEEAVMETLTRLFASKFEES